MELAQLEPVTIELYQDHPFKKKTPDPVTGRKRIGCAECGKAKTHRNHLGAPPSLNAGGTGIDWTVYSNLRDGWKAMFEEALRGSGLEPCEAISVEAQIGFADRRTRDEGNVRWLIEKALGDVLVEHGYLPDDSIFPVRRYSFGGVTGVLSPRRSFLRLTLFPSPVAEHAIEQGALPL